MRQDERRRGIVHVHTERSADGLLSVGEIARMCRARGLAFACIADHAEDLDEDAVASLVRECEEQSGDDFVLVPGLEHRFGQGVHILALGQKRPVRFDTRMDTLSALADECVLVAAHCTSRHDLPPRLLEMLSAVEIWNVSRDTRFLPKSGCFAAYRRWAGAYPSLYAIGGVDMHRGTEWGCEVVLEGACELTADAVLGRLRAGEFVTRGTFLSFGSRPTGGARGIAFAAGDALAGARDARNRVLSHG
jgi:hypothetical protein